jgi:hypothetical protein
MSSFLGVDIDREIEEIRHEGNDLAVFGQIADLQHIDTLEDQDVRPVDGGEFAGQHIVGQVRIARSLTLC